MCRLEFNFQNLPFSKCASKNVPFTCEWEAYPSHFSPFSKCAGIVCERSLNCILRCWLWFYVDCLLLKGRLIPAEIQTLDDKKKQRLTFPVNILDVIQKAELVCPSIL